MERRSLAIILTLAAGLAGCGGEFTPRPGPASPHGGIMVPLPSGKGVVEVLKEAAPGKAGTPEAAKPKVARKKAVDL